MAIVVLGQTKCCLCNELLLDGEEIVSLPPLFYNQRDPAWRLNDSGVHHACLIRVGLADRAMGKLAEVEARAKSPKICVVCGEVITDPGEYFSTGPLSDGPDDPLEAISWVEAHLTHLDQWDGTPEMVRVLEQASHSSEWEGDVLERLLETIRSVWIP
jgi:hypothetical protein